MTRWSIDGATLLDPEAPPAFEARGRPGGAGSLERGAPRRVVIEGDRIEAVCDADGGSPDEAASIPARRRYDARGLSLAPGFIDLHFHGELLFARPTSFAGALERASLDLARHGTTSFLATTVAWEADRLLEYVTHLAEVMTQSRQSGARAIGLHLEGPWINPDAAGAQPADSIRPFRREDLAILSACGDLLKMVTLAPEIEGADRLIETLQRSGVVPALGHSRVDALAAEEAFRRGMTHVTHLFNAMGSLHHREPGLPGAVLGSREALSCDLICDGVHVAPALVRVAARCLGDRLSLISDRIDLPAAAGPGPGPESGSGPLQTGLGFGSGDLVDDGTAWRLADDGRLAGSRLTLDRAVRNAQDFGAMDALASIAAVTLRPARLLGLEHEIGTLRPGSRADLVLLDPAGEVVATWVGGQLVHPVSDASPPLRRPPPARARSSAGS